MIRTRSARHAGLLASLALVVPMAMLVPVPTSALAPTLQQKLVAPDGVPSDEFGAAVAVDGTTVVVGAPHAQGGKGAVYVFERSGDSWGHVATLTASDGSAYAYLGASVAVEGDTIVAGGRGLVYTFARTGSAARTETAKLTASDGVAGDDLGISVAIDGETIVAGAPGTANGAVYTFARTGPGVRYETAKLTASDGAVGDRLGYSVAIDGDTVVAGAPSDSVGANDYQGSVYTFARTGPVARTETAKLTASDGAADDYLGRTVALEGDTVVVGDPYDDIGPAADRGSVYTFASTGAAARNETGKLTASDGAAGDDFGFSVAIAGDTIVAGATLDDVGGTLDQGSVYTFARTGPVGRTETGKLTASDGVADDWLGHAMAIGGNTIVAGASRYAVTPTTAQGSARVFFAPAPVPGPVPDTTAPDTTGLKGPKRVEKGEVAKFRFASTEPGSTFRCKVDKKRWKACTSPYKVKTTKLKVGKHTVRVVAVDAAGNVDPSPARKTLRVVRRDSSGRYDD